MTKMTELELLKHGSEFRVYVDLRGGLVYKFPRGRNPEVRLRRYMDDYRLVCKSIDKQYLLPCVYGDGFISIHQVYLPGTDYAQVGSDNYDYTTDKTPLQEISKGGVCLARNFGVEIDWFGLDVFSYFRRFCADKDFWVIPNIYKYMGRERRDMPELKIVDYGLLLNKFSIKSSLCRGRSIIFDMFGACFNRTMMRLVCKRSGLVWEF